MKYECERKGVVIAVNIKLSVLEVNTKLLVLEWFDESKSN